MEGSKREKSMRRSQIAGGFVRARAREMGCRSGGWERGKPKGRFKDGAGDEN